MRRDTAHGEPRALATSLGAGGVFSVNLVVVSYGAPELLRPQPELVSVSRRDGDALGPLPAARFGRGRRPRLVMARVVFWRALSAF